MGLSPSTQQLISNIVSFIARPSRIGLLFAVCVGVGAALFVLEVPPFRDTLLDCTVRIWLSPDPPPVVNSFTSASPRSRSIAPRDLLDDPSSVGISVDGDSASVPRLIHQSWKSTELPARFAKWSDTWRVRHPDWLHVLWTDVDNRELVERFYPEYLEAYDALPREIYRADMARNFYMHRFGGLYIDADLESIKPIDDLLASTQPTVFLARMGYDDDYSNSIPNAFMASTPQHRFWFEPLAWVQDHYSALQDDLPEVLHGGEAFGPEELTGPVPLWRAATAYSNSAAAAQDRLVILPPRSIFPYDHHNYTAYERCVCKAQSSTLDTSRCKALYPEAYAISYWSQSWGVVNWAQLAGRVTHFTGPVLVAVVVLGLLAGCALLAWWFFAAARNASSGHGARSVELEALLDDSDWDASVGRPRARSSPRISPKDEFMKREL